MVKKSFLPKGNVEVIPLMFRQSHEKSDGRSTCMDYASVLLCIDLYCYALFIVLATSHFFRRHPGIGD